MCPYLREPVWSVTLRIPKYRQPVHFRTRAGRLCRSDSGRRSSVVSEDESTVRSPHDILQGVLGATPMVNLSLREWEIAARIAAGETNRKISDDLGISRRTVETFVERARDKLGFTSRAQIGVWFGARTAQEDIASSARLSRSTAFGKQSEPLGEPRNLFLPGAPALEPRENFFAPTTPLIGREHDLDAVVSMLQQPSGRILTLTGPSGVGKTRLALAAANAIAPSFADGVVLADLSAIRQPDAAVGAIAKVIGVQ